MAAVDFLSPEVCDRDVIIMKSVNPSLAWTTYGTLPGAVWEVVGDEVDLTVQGVVGWRILL